MTTPSHARRIAMTTAAVFAGFVGALAVAAPAAAHVAMVHGEAACDDKTGSWVVTWTVENSFPATATLSNVKFVPTATQTLGEVPAKKDGVNGKITATVVIGPESVPADKTARLSFDSEWKKDHFHENGVKGEVSLKGTCAKPVEAAPTASFVSQCDGTATLTLRNSQTTGPAVSFTLVGQNGYNKGGVLHPEGATITIPASAAGLVVVTFLGDNLAGQTRFEFKWAKPANCGAPAPVLPKTGSRTGLMVGTGGLLLVAGVAALVLVRRRQRVTFVAE